MSKFSIDIGELVGLKGEEQLSKIGFEKQTLSMGYQACGALELWNYPSFFRDLIPQNLDGTSRSDRIDLAALEGMKFRGSLFCTISSWYKGPPRIIQCIKILKITHTGNKLSSRTNIVALNYYVKIYRNMLFNFQEFPNYYCTNQIEP